MPTFGADIACHVAVAVWTAGCRRIVDAITGGSGVPVEVSTIGIPSTGIIIIGVGLGEGTIKTITIILNLVKTGGIISVAESINGEGSTRTSVGLSDEGISRIMSIICGDGGSARI